MTADSNELPILINPRTTRLGAHPANQCQAHRSEFLNPWFTAVLSLYVLVEWNETEARKIGFCRNFSWVESRKLNFSVVLPYVPPHRCLQCLTIGQSHLISQKSTTKHCCDINLFLHLDAKLAVGRMRRCKKENIFVRIRVPVTSTEICYHRKPTW